MALKGITTRFSNPIFTGTQTGNVYPVAQSAAAVSGAADTNENTLATINIAANQLGANGGLRITTWWAFNSDASAKTVNIRFSGAAGTIFGTWNGANTTGGKIVTEIYNRNATNSQFGGNTVISNAAGVSQAVTTGTIDTTAATTVVLTATKADSADTMTLSAYVVEVIRAS